jgi:hypothetical protein
VTYSILSLASGNILESYRSEERVLEAVYRICSTEPEARDSLAVATFDDDGMLVDSVDGEALTERLSTFAADHHAATA